MRSSEAFRSAEPAPMRAVLHQTEISDDAAGAADANTFFALVTQALQTAGVIVLSPASLSQQEITQAGTSNPELPDIWLTVGWPCNDGQAVAEKETSGIPWGLVVPELLHADELAANADAVKRACAVIVVGSGSAHAVALLTYATRIVQLAPFIDTAPYRAAYALRNQHKAAIASRLQLPLATPWLLALIPHNRDAMSASISMLAQACSQLATLDWHLIIAGEDGTLDEIRALLRPLSSHRLRFWPSLSLDERAQLCVSCDFLFWPALGDAGLDGLLQAQAAGMPVVTCASERVRERVQDGVTGRLAKADNTASLANQAAFFLRHPGFVRTCATQAREMVLTGHDVRSQGRKLRQELERVLEIESQ